MLNVTSRYSRCQTFADAVVTSDVNNVNKLWCKLFIMQFVLGYGHKLILTGNNLFRIESII